jgi:hypothetical protein
MIDYAATFTNFTGAFPNIEAVNVSAPGAGDGTEFVAALVNDIWGRAQALLHYAGMTPNGVQEAPDTAQILTALSKGYGIGPGIGVIYWKNGAPAANGDRVLLLQGQVIPIANYPLLAAAVYVGDANNDTAPAFYKTSDAGGTTRSTAGTYLVLPDTRGLSLKGVGNATVNTRTKIGPAALGEVQEDQGQGDYEQNSVYPYFRAITGSGSGYGIVLSSSDQGLGRLTMDSKITDGINGTPRTGANTRDSSIGTNFGITY